MKKRLVLSILALSALLLLTGCSQDPKVEGTSNTSSGQIEAIASASAETTADVVVNERVFMGQINDIYLNSDDYLGKTIQYEGVYAPQILEYDDTSSTYHLVSRYAPGCCEGEYTFVGFEVVYDGEYPKEDAWVEATGTLEEYEENGSKYLHLVLSSLIEKEPRGEEFVTQ